MQLVHTRFALRSIYEQRFVCDCLVHAAPSPVFSLHYIVCIELVKMAILISVRYRSCAYTVNQTVQRHGVYSAAYGAVDYKEPLKSFKIRL